MPDREKVDKGLACCQYSSKTHCYECPYLDGSYSTNYCTVALVSDALALLKEKEAIEPDVDSEGTCSCGNCGTTVEYYPDECSVFKKLCKYCTECGHEVKWE